MGGKGWRRLPKSANQSMDNLERIVRNYAAFEARMNRLSTDIWFQWCSNCAQVCCKPVYCRESIESPFLSLLIKKSIAKPFLLMPPHRGWLNETGCNLTVGRPPVCYEFLCDRILDSQPPGLQHYATIVLAKLVSHIGKRALGPRHLIEIMDPVKLRQVKFSRFEKRLSEALCALEIIQSIFSGDKLDGDALEILSKIHGAPMSKDAFVSYRAF